MSSHTFDSTWTLAPLHPECPVVFPSVGLRLSIYIATVDGTGGVVIEWGSGGLSVDGNVDQVDLSLDGPAQIQVPYLCGQLDSDRLLGEVSVQGSVAALSTLHGLTHHPLIERFWRERTELVDAAVHSCPASILRANLAS